MRQREKKWKRAGLAWIAVGFLIAQLLLGFFVDRSWLAVRDPEFVMLLDRLTQRRAEAPGRPLVLALGSSRTEMGLHADLLNQSADTARPLVFNFGIPGSGLMVEQLMLRRLLDQGIRPDLVFLEAMPMAMTMGQGAPMEEHNLDGARMTVAEIARMIPYFHQPYRLLKKYVLARIYPCHRHQAELRAALGLDAAGDARTGGQEASLISAYGFRGAGIPSGPEQIATETHLAVARHNYALKDRRLAAGPFRALRDLLELCRRERIPAAMVIPPEGAAFRAAFDAGSQFEERIREIAHDFGVVLYDARTWIADEGFLDGHHLAGNGADQYTARFGREILEPELRRITPPGRQPLARAR